MVQHLTNKSFRKRKCREDIIKKKNTELSPKTSKGAKSGIERARTGLPDKTQDFQLNLNFK